MKDRVWGECQRSGRRVLLSDMVRDGQNYELLVAQDEYDPWHPQLDATPLRDHGEEGRVRFPAPEIVKLVGPVLTASAEPMIEEGGGEVQTVIVLAASVVAFGNTYIGADPLDHVGQEIPGTIDPAIFPERPDLRLQQFYTVNYPLNAFPYVLSLTLDDVNGTPEEGDDFAPAAEDAFTTVYVQAMPDGVVRSYDRLASVIDTGQIDRGVRQWEWVITEGEMLADDVEYRVWLDLEELPGGEVVTGVQAALSWTEGYTPGLWKLYHLYRVVGGGEPELVVTNAVERDWNASILTDLREHFDEAGDTSVPVSYYVIAVDHNDQSVRSNTVTINPADWPPIEE
jgi:hypothetical protein